MRWVALLFLLFYSTAKASSTLENDHSAICTYQSSISTHITYELLKGTAYEQAVRLSFALFENSTDEEDMDYLEKVLLVHLDRNQRETFGKTMGLAGLVWAGGFRNGWVIGTYDDLYERSYETCMEGLEDVGPASYFNAYYETLIYHLQQPDRSRS